MLLRLFAWRWGCNLQTNDSFEAERDAQESHPSEVMMKLVKQQLDRLVPLKKQQVKSVSSHTCHTTNLKGL
jgi:hypothetical protein